MSWLHPQIASDTKHTGVVASVTQALSLSDEQTAHWPARGLVAGWQAGSAALGQASGPGFVDE